jgi:hypothetical protein
MAKVNSVGRARINGQPDGLSIYPFSWYRADCVNIISGGVESWGDMSGNGRHQIQVTSTKRGTLLRNAANGKPSVLHDGTDDFSIASYTLAQAFTRFVVWRSRVIGAAAANDVICDGGTALSTALLSQSAPATFMFAGATLGPSTNYGNNVYAAAVMVFSGVNSELWVKDSTIATPTRISRGNAGGATSAGFSFGASATGTRPTNSEILEGVDYSGTLPEADIRMLFYYANDRYGI